MGRLMADAAQEAEEVIDRHVVDQLRNRSQEESYRMTTISSFCQDINKVIGKIDSITKELMMMAKEEWADVQKEQPMVSVTVGLPEVVPCSGKKSTMVGFDEHLVRVMDELTSGGSNLQILPIVGMGGIGKTTLVQNAFHHPYIEHYFHTRIWFTISHEYSVREILLRQFHNGEDQESNETLVGLGERFYKSLFGERYLIIMDDVWSTKVWDDLKMFFPNNNNGSRIMLTTRESSVAISLGSYKPYVIGFSE
ncbi:UNVERIFIED_CONTAM: putative disease resistance protein [Sesamum calycinum]|uniref:Disease resistance protein n=1 Tax=Sesamum calycinum TaxID=2727403 RepID=A0AAW2NDD5_9LAMI